MTTIWMHYFKKEFSKDATIYVPPINKMTHIYYTQVCIYKLIYIEISIKKHY